MNVSELIGEHVDWGVIDCIHVDTCGVVRVEAWSLHQSELIELPQLHDATGEIPMNALWRVFRRDVGPRGFPAGVVIQFVAKQDRSCRDLRMTFQGRTIWHASGVIEFQLPNYAPLLVTPEVRTRGGIYGCGPPVTRVDPEIDQLTAIVEGRCLDFGCGSGALVAHLRQNGVDAHGIEIDRGAIRAATLPEVAPFITLYEGGNLPFEDGAFDWAVAVEVLEHIPRFREALSEVARICRKCLITVPDMSSIPLLFRHRVVPWHLLESTHVNFFTQQSLQAELALWFDDIRFVRLGRFTVNASDVFTSIGAVCASRS